MPVTTPAALIPNVAVLADLLGRAADEGLPLPTTCVRVDQFGINLQWDSPDEVWEWAAWLDTAVVAQEPRSGYQSHIAETVVNGVHVQLVGCYMVKATGWVRA